MTEKYAFADFKSQAYSGAVMKPIKTAILVLGLAAGGCSMLGTQSFSGKEDIKNAQGHVIGYKETVAGEDAARVVLYVPRVGERGAIIGYEEFTKGGGAVLRDLDGRRIGNRMVDLRSRGSNARNGGLLIVFHRTPQSERLAQAQLAALTIEDLKQHLQLTN